MALPPTRPTSPSASRCSLLLASSVLALLAGCSPPSEPVLGPLPAGNGAYPAVRPRLDGDLGAPTATGPALYSYGRGGYGNSPGGRAAEGAPNARIDQGGTITLDFADTDIRDAVSQILGALLRVNYTIDPAVKGTVTLHTATPLTTRQLLPTMQALLAQVGAEMLQSGGLYRIVNVGVAGGAGGGGTPNMALAEGASVGGASAVQLRYANAEDLAKALQPFVGQGAKVTAVPGSNALLIAGDPQARNTLLDMISAFDVDALAGQSYALLPVESGTAKDMATSLQDALRGQNKTLADVVRVIPMSRVDAVLVTSPQPAYITAARRLFALVERSRRNSIRAWHVYYLQNSHADDTANLLQQAFTPNNVTVQPSAPRQLPQGGALGGQQSGSGSTLGSGSSLGGGNSLSGSGGTGGGSIGGIGGGSISGGGSSAGSTGAPSTPPSGGASSNPLLGGLDNAGGGGNAENTMRIIPNTQNNAVLVYGTEHETDAVSQMLRRIDIVPLQVRIDAIVAEVDLNDNLQYGTQFFFKSGGINGVLSNATTSTGTVTSTIAGTVASIGLGATLPGLVIGGLGTGGGPLAISALQAVTKVHVLSSPELMVVDNQPARLQVGQLVPYQSGTAQSTLTSTASIVSQIQYQPVGVILEVTPRINTGGLVTLDVSQEVSTVATGTTTTGVNSPTFNTQNVNSRVVVADGQTVGIAGLIRDNTTKANSGIPWLKDIPLLGLLGGTQTNSRTRQELLVLITPHVVRDQHDAQSLTEDLREHLSDAASVPYDSVAPSGSADPNQRLKRSLGLER
ncbi:type II secretion system secretin GspD [Lichenicoccus roseus]|uniref:Type II secretion system protein GspD n=1 Tax=Lichenicoccus roseus TaxID=2683649 RepID=A0A5R9J721_9PROT|nr:type II secretion system secretin GspD [Lichenicoccus roseus]TLU71411.1 type II secretion system protein GspD [Lichenicoccus roseus]